MVRRHDRVLLACPPHGCAVRPKQEAKLLVAESGTLGGAQQAWRDGIERPGAQPALKVEQLGKLVHEPRIIAGEPRHGAFVHAALQRVADIERPLGMWRDQSFADALRLDPVAPVGAPAHAPDLETAEHLLPGFREGTADRHRLAHGLHLRAQRFIRSGELLESPARRFDDNIIKCRLERCRGFTRDVVRELIQRIAHGKLGRDLGDRKACRFGRQRRGSRHARVHLDHNHAPVTWVDRELYVRAPGFDPDRAHDARRHVAQPLVFAVGQGLGGRDRDAVAGMHSHGVDVLDRADDHDVVGTVAHHLQLELFPADQALLDQDLPHGRHVEPMLDDRTKILDVVGDPAAAAAECEGGPHDRGKAGRAADGQRLVE